MHIDAMFGLGGVFGLTKQMEHSPLKITLITHDQLSYSIASDWVGLLKRWQVSIHKSGLLNQKEKPDILKNSKPCNCSKKM